MEREKANHPVRRLCRVFGVAPSGYWAWLQRGVSARAQADAQLSARIGALHQASRGTYGAPRIHAALAAEGTHCGRKRVARLMRQAGLVGCHRRRPFHATHRDPQAEPAPDLVQRQFVATQPNQLWIADITYVPTRYEDFLYLAVVLDVFSRRVVGWAMAAHLRAELVVNALEMAVWNRQPGAGVIHHWDHGSQYTSLLFGERCQAASVRWDRWVTATITPWPRASLRPWNVNCSPDGPSRPTLRPARRSLSISKCSTTASVATRRSALGYLSPDEFERRWAAQILVVA